MKKILARARRAAADYRMIAPGDEIAVGVSGGKDSLVALAALARLREFLPGSFELIAVSVALGLPDMDLSGVRDLCAALCVPYKIVKTNIYKTVFETREEKNPCALCANLRRGALNRAASGLGCAKVALGHHMDDAVDTFLLSLLYEGRLHSFAPVTYLDRTGITQIRPLIYCRESDIADAAQRLSLPVLKSTCPSDRDSRRREVGRIAAVLLSERSDIYQKIFGAMRRLPLPGFALPGPDEKAGGDL